MTEYLPFKISYFENGHLIEIPCRGVKRVLAEARPLARKGYNVQAWKHDEKIGDWSHDVALQSQINMLPRSENARHSTGSVQAYVALQRLSAIANSMAPQARKRVLTGEEMVDLLSAMEETDDALGLTKGSMAESLSE